MFILQWIELLDFFSQPPGSMILILLLSTVVAIISALLTKWLVDTDELQRKQVQIKSHNEEKEKIIALAQTDVERYRKQRKRWERRDQILKKSQTGMAWQRMKPSCITFIPMLIIFAIVRDFFGINPIALTPMNANDIFWIGGIVAAATETAVEWAAVIFGEPTVITMEMGWINFTAWYFLCSFGINTLVQRFMKLQTQAMGGMDQMFGGSKAKALEFPDV